MTYKWGHKAWTGVAIIAAGLVLSPAFGAVSDLMRAQNSSAVSLIGLGRIAAFTPTTKDPRLAAAYASAVQASNRKGFRFTPVGGSIGNQRSLTVLVRAGGDTGVSVQRTLPDLGITPVAFSLNVQRGWRKLAVIDAGRKEIDPVMVETLSATKGFSIEKHSRFSTSALTDIRREGGTMTPQMLVPEKNEAVDLASSYSLSRNLNVTAGLRYRAPSRQSPITDTRADSQALYLGTVFKF